MTGFYSRAAMREAREKRDARVGDSQLRAISLSDVPADAAYEDEAAVLHVWADDKFVPYAKWLASAPISVESVAIGETAVPVNAKCLVGDCNGIRVWLVRDGERWLMHAGSRGTGGRRRDFASPFLGHAIRTAEFWYGAPATGWRAEGNGNGNSE